MKTRIGLAAGLIIAALAAAPAAQAAVIYSQTFDTDTADMLTTYGWSPGIMSSFSASGGQARFDQSYEAGNSLGVYTSNFNLDYNWSAPLTFSVDVGWPTASTATMGISLNPGTAPSGNSGFGWTSYLGNYGEFIKYPGDAGGQYVWLQQTVAPASETINNTFAMTIRQNAGDSGLFDAKLTINDVVHATPSGTWGTGGGFPMGVDGDWIVGFSKSYYGLDGADPINSISVGSGGNPPFSGGRLDNVTLTMIPEPASLGMLGAAAVAMLLRRRFRR